MCRSNNKSVLPYKLNPQMLRRFIQKSGAHMSNGHGHPTKSQSQINTGILTQESTAEKSSVTVPNNPPRERSLLPSIKSPALGNSTMHSGIHQVISSGSFNSFSKGAEKLANPPTNSKHKIRVMPRGNQPYSHPPKTESLKYIAPCVGLQNSNTPKISNSANLASGLAEDSYMMQGKQFSAKDTSLERSGSKMSSPFYMPANPMQPETTSSVPNTPVKYLVGKYKKQRQEEVFEQIVKVESGVRGFQTARNSQTKVPERTPRQNQSSSQTKAVSGHVRGKEFVKSQFFKTMIEQSNRSIEELPMIVLKKWLLTNSFPLTCPET